MNEIQLSNDLEILTNEIIQYGNTVQISYWEVGRRLKFIKENKLNHGEFMNYLKEIVCIDYNDANRLMSISEMPKLSTWQNLPKRNLFLISTLPEEDRTKEHTTSKGETKTPDEMTVRELQELKKQLKVKDNQIQMQAKMIDDLQEQEPEVVEKEVIPEDYEQLKSQATSYKQRVADLEARNTYIEGEYRDLLASRKDVDEKSKKYEELSEAINQAKGQLDKSRKMVSNYKKLFDLLKESNNFLVKASGLIYQDLSEVLNNDGLARQELDYLVERLEKFLLDIKKISNKKEIIEGEIINE